MAFQSTFTPIELGDLLNLTRAKHDAGYRFAQMLCAMADEGIDLVYSFIKQDDEGTWQLENYVIGGLDPATQTVPSVTGYYLSAFPFENEAHDLFGVRVEGLQSRSGGVAVTLDRDEKPAASERAMDQIRSKFGASALAPATLLGTQVPARRSFGGDAAQDG